ncbi:class F sortase [Sesbania bispinosa]|nr:class F sortase [Sesbania bispinosa]
MVNKIVGAVGASSRFAALNNIAAPVKEDFSHVYESPAPPILPQKPSIGEGPSKAQKAQIVYPKEKLDNLASSQNKPDSILKRPTFVTNLRKLARDQGTSGPTTLIAHIDSTTLIVPQQIPIANPP